MEAHERLEAEVADWVGAKQELVVACSSGTAALHLALEALQLRQSGRGAVLTPDLAMVAVARSVVMAGLEPVFIDCDDSLNMHTVRSAEAFGHMGKQVRALVAVHTYGRVCSTDTLAAQCRHHNAHLIEDMAEAHGVAPHEYTSAACYSFYRNKVVGGEEGGCVVFRRRHHADLARKLRCLGFTEQHDFTHLPRGHNYRLAPSLARLVSESLRKFPDNVRRRRDLERWMNLIFPQRWRMPERQSPWVYDLRVPGMLQAQQSMIVHTLNKLKIPARHCFKPMTVQPEFEKCLKFGGENALKASREVFYLSLDPRHMTEAKAQEAYNVIVGCLSPS